MIYQKTEKRIAQYISFLDRAKYSSIEEIMKIKPPVCNWEFAVTNQIYRTPPGNDTLDWESIERFPFSYGNSGETWWFRTIFHFPEVLDNQEIFLEVDTQTDTLVFVNDIPVGAVNPFHGKIRLTPFYKPGAALKIDLEAWAGYVFPGYHPFDGPRVLTTIAHRQESYPLILKSPRWLVKENEIYNLYYDAAVLFETAQLQKEESLLRSQINQKLHRILLDIDITANRDTLISQAKKARAKISLFLSNRNGTLAPQIYSTGNAHLDHAWLWPISETSRKGARTCANMAAFTEEFPEFRYLHSQPAQMVDLKKNYPAVFERVKDAVTRGQWEPNGGMWVEADCNLTGGESLIRQFLLGHKTTKELFDYRGNVLWLPDVFGYSACLPQIMKGCKIEYFVTSKINWNDTTRFPFDLFLWKGLDGTQIPTHFITTAYEGRNIPSETAAAWSKVQHKEVQTSLLRSIGEGDGGGGTMRADLEYMRRMTDLQGIPKNGWSGLSEAMKKVFSEADNLPEFTGELYLELHRGTYTTQAQIKRYNRKLEYALRDLEIKEVRIFLTNYPKKKEFTDWLHLEISDVWKELLTLQFHDILPGSSVRQVNVEAIEVFKALTSRLHSASCEADKILCFRGEEDHVTFVNSLPFKRTTMIIMPQELPAPELSPPVQKIKTTENETVLAALVTLEGMALSCQDNFPIPETIEKVPFIVVDDKIQTPWYDLEFDPLGGISEMTMKESGRTVTLSGSSLNAFLMVEDLPVNWDAWDIEDDYRFKEHREGKLLSREVVSKGEICLQIRQKLSIGEASVITQDIFFYTHTSRIDFQTHVDWQEEHRLLRVNFPTSVSAWKGFFDIPFGYAERDTHRNRPEDRARFEVCAHKWACIKDARLSAALLSDCKYGYRVEGGLLSLTLLRAPTAPDHLADRGEHNFTYAFFPSNNTDIRNVIKEGWDLNIPAKVIAGSLLDGMSEPLFNLSQEDVMIEAVKVSEDRKGIILRLCESVGAPINLTVIPAAFSGFRDVVETNMLEETVKELRLNNGSVDLSLHGFEVKTLKFYT